MSKDRLTRYWRKQGYRCHYCGNPLTRAEATEDHVFPQYMGYTRLNNIVAACVECNGEKGCAYPSWEIIESVQYLDPTFKIEKDYFYGPHYYSRQCGFGPADHTWFYVEPYLEVVESVETVYTGDLIRMLREAEGRNDNVQNL